MSFEPVSRSRVHASLSRNRQLLQAGNSELGHMEAALGGTDCRVLLTDAQGVIIHATDLPQAHDQPLLRAASRVGVNIAESHIGTSAPGIVVRTGEASSVAGGEHFHQCLQGLYCAAAPIHDIHGARVLALLGDSITTDHISPAGSIKADSPAGRYLIEKGVKPADFNSYGARRGNHEVMMRGTFANIRLRNELAGGKEGWWTATAPGEMGDALLIDSTRVEPKRQTPWLWSRLSPTICPARARGPASASPRALPQAASRLAGASSSAPSTRNVRRRSGTTT